MVGVGVNTGKISVDEQLTPGGMYKIRSITVLNTGDEAGDYSVRVQYLHGQNELRPPEEWVVFEPDTFHLNPGESEIVEIRLNIPLDAEPGEYFCLLEAHPISEEGGFSIGVAAATKLYFSVKYANIFFAALNKLSSRLSATAPASFIIIIAAMAIALIMVLRRYISLEVKRKRPPV